MSGGSAGEWGWGERWDQLYAAMSAEPRRMVLLSLLDAAPGEQLPLPEAAESPNQSMDAETLTIHLLHHHLPKLAEPGYVRWERDPLRVRRGPHFDEAALVVETLMDSIDEMPPSLANNCRILKEMHDDAHL
jgi:hypothetical protein